MIASFVHRDPVDPGLEIRAGVETCECAIAAQKCLLHDLLGVCFVFNDAEGHAKHAVAVPRHKHAIGVLVPGEHRPDQRVVFISHARIR